MKNVLKIEEFAMLALGFFLFLQLNLAWWWFFVLLLTPDIAMLGYLFGPKTGALIYNIFHHKGIAIALYIAGATFWPSEALQLIGIIVFSHAAMDRLFGYGLKYDKGFKYTHLGEIGQKNG